MQLWLHCIKKPCHHWLISLWASIVVNLGVWITVCSTWRVPTAGKRGRLLRQRRGSRALVVQRREGSLRETHVHRVRRQPQQFCQRENLRAVLRGSETRRHRRQVPTTELYKIEEIKEWIKSTISSSSTFIRGYLFYFFLMFLFQKVRRTTRQSLKSNQLSAAGLLVCFG